MGLPGVQLRQRVNGRDLLRLRRRPARRSPPALGGGNRSGHLPPAAAREPVRPVPLPRSRGPAAGPGRAALVGRARLVGHGVFGPFDPRILGIGDASTGLCGGMVTTARDLFEAGIPPPADSEPPANGSPRFRSIVRRQVESLDWLRVPLRFFDLQAFRPDPPTAIAVFLRREPPRVVAVRDEWPKIRAGIDAGRAPILGLVRTASSSPRDLTSNHQVLAYAYEVASAGFRSGSTTPTTRVATTSSCGLTWTRPTPAPRPTGSGLPSRPANRCAASSASRTRVLIRWPPGGERGGRRSPAATGATQP